MSATRKREGVKRGSQNKAQLVRELAELKVRLAEREKDLADCQDRLADARSPSSNVSEASQPTATAVLESDGLDAGLEERGPESNLLEQKIISLTDESERLRQENEALRKRLQEEKEKALKENETAKRLQREAERQQHHLKSRIQELEKKVAQPNVDFEGREPAEIPVTQEAAIRPTVASAPKDISIKPERDSSPLGPAVDAIKPVHSEMVPSEQPAASQENADESRDHQRDRKHTAVAKLSLALPGKSRKVLQQIDLQQFQRTLTSGTPVVARQPFFVRARLHFPITPTLSQLDIDNSTFDVHVLAIDASGKSVINRSGVAEVLVAGASDYDSNVPMTGLNTGKYLLKVYARSRFAETEDCQRLELTVVE